MLLVVMKHGGTWEMLASIFNVKAPAFEKMITGFLRVVSPKLYEDQVMDETGRNTMTRLARTEHTFRHFPCALYATDVKFQQSNRPVGNMAEGKPYYRGKHKLYGLKVEMSVSPLGLAINCTEHFAGATNGRHSNLSQKHGVP